MTCETCGATVHPLDMEVLYAGATGTPLMVCPKCDRRVKDSRFNAWLDTWMPRVILSVVSAVLTASILHYLGGLK